MVFTQKFRKLDYEGGAVAQILRLAIESDKKPTYLTDFIGGTAVFREGDTDGEEYSLAKHMHPLGLTFVVEAGAASGQSSYLMAIMLPPDGPGNTIEKPLELGDTLTLVRDGEWETSYRAE